MSEIRAPSEQAPDQLAQALGDADALLNLPNASNSRTAAAFVKPAA